MEQEPDQLSDNAVLPRNFREFILKWGTKFAIQSKPPVLQSSLPKPPSARAKQFSTRMVKLLNYLNQPLFWLGIIFLAWLLLELVLPPAVRAALTNWQPLITISGAVAIGYWTNWCAVKMIFYPRVKNAVWWGLIPARRQELTELITESMVTKLVSPEIVQAYLAKDELLHAWVVKCAAALGSLTQEKEFRSELKQLLARYLRQWLAQPQTAARLGELIQNRLAALEGDSLTQKVFSWTKSLWGPVVQAKISHSLAKGDWLVAPLSEVIDEWLEDVPAKLEDQVAYLETLIIRLITAGLENLNLKAMISAQLEQMDESQFEKILTGNLSPELVFIQVSGGVLGGLVGTAMFYPWLRVALLVLGLGLWVIYRVTREPERRV